MAKVSKEEQDYIDLLATALRDIEITEEEMIDMRLLYKCANGVPFNLFDGSNRPRGPTAKSSSTLGSKIQRVIGAPDSYYGINFVGDSRNDSKRYMKDDFRAAIDQAKIFGAIPVVDDEPIPWMRFKTNLMRK